MGMEEMFTVQVIVFATVLTLIFGFYLMGQFNTKLTPMYATLGLPAEDNVTYQNFSNQMVISLKNVDNLMPFAYGLIVIVMALMAFQLRTHPAWLPITLIAGISGVFIANVFQTIITTFETTSPLNTVSTVTDIPYSTLLMDNLPKLAVFAIAIIIIALYSRGTMGGGGFKE